MNMNPWTKYKDTLMHNELRPALESIRLRLHFLSSPLQMVSSCMADVPLSSLYVPLAIHRSLQHQEFAQTEEVCRIIHKFEQRETNVQCSSQRHVQKTHRPRRYAPLIHTPPPSTHAHSTFYRASYPLSRDTENALLQRQGLVISKYPPPPTAFDKTPN